ncbi:MAG: alpha/beta hydrolase [Actinobacteria bacterium]|nr:alpha/beta hydrolase [Actinomycetota bacterium]MCA1721678.1 alpha/beta hydrolase [Actinomycetota bacterium]
MELACREVGTGQPLVLLHAFPLSSAMWLGQREGLGHRCRVITPDQRGFGGSELGDEPPSLDACADDVAELLDRLALDRVVLGGLSMGGYVAMAFLRRHPDRVAALVLADTKASADPEPVRANRERIAAAVLAEGSTVLQDEVLPTLLGTTTMASRPGVLGRVRGLVQAAPSEAVAWAQRAMAARPDSLDTLRGYDGPALVLVGEQDLLSPVADAQAMADALPQGRLAVLPEAGHLTAVETPEAFTEQVAGFLAALEA